MLTDGDRAPDFELSDHRGEPVRLSDYRGQRVVLYFYPKADTPGCTTEACSFRDAYDAACDRTGPSLIEVQTDREENRDVHEQMEQKVAATVDAVMA